MSRHYDFHERLRFSKGVVAATCRETIKDLIPGCVEVKETTTTIDKTGVDYIAVLRRGAEVYIDHKAREGGCSKYWGLGGDNKPEPEIALELWSVKPSNERDGKAGWTLDEAKLTHYTLHTFDKSDSVEAFLLPFQLLRKAYRENFDHWNAVYKHGIQDSGSWKSECVFVPISTILTALRRTMRALDVIIEDSHGNNQRELFE